MDKKDSARLSALQGVARTMLLVSLVFFLVALFALVSHWDTAYPVMAAACVFSLVSGQICRRRYRNAFVKALLERTVARRVADAKYAYKEDADGLPGRLGLAPEQVPFAAGAKLHHTIRGQLHELPFLMAETAFVRMQKGRPGSSIAGTLLSVEGLLPKEEAWVMVREDALGIVCTGNDFDAAGYRVSPAALPEDIAARVKDGSADEHMSVCAEWLKAMKLSRPAAALSAKDGRLTLLLSGSFYVPNRIDTYKPFQESMLEGNRLVAIEDMSRLVRKLRGVSESDAPAGGD